MPTPKDADRELPEAIVEAISNCLVTISIPIVQPYKFEDTADSNTILAA